MWNHRKNSNIAIALLGKKIHFGGAQIIFLLTLRFREAVTSKREREGEIENQE